MSVVRFIADLHLGHKFMASKRGFENIDDHNNYLIKQWNSVVKKNDITYILGDITMETSKFYPLLNQLNGIKYVVLGNHDTAKDTIELLKYVKKIYGAIKYRGIWLTHIPIHPSELEYRANKNIHGHIHSSKINDERYYCVSCEHLDFKPHSLEELKIER